MSEFELRWSGGSLDLLGWNEGDFEIFASADGVDFGNPEPVRTTLRSALLDGSISTKERDDNRTVELELLVMAPDGQGLAEGEKALSLLDGRRCELAWSPPDEFAPTAVFVAVSAELRHSKKLSEELALVRRYTLTLDCLPHAYSDEWVEIPALASSVSTPTVIDDGTSTTGWATSAGTLATSGGSVTTTIPDPNGRPQYLLDPVEPIREVI